MAGRRCQICAHPERERIEALRAIGTTLETLAERFSVDRTNLSRHWSNHVSPERRMAYLLGPAQTEELRLVAARENGSVLEYFGALRSILMGQVVQRAEAGDTFKVSNAARALIDVLREIGKITGEIEQQAAGGGTFITNNVAVLTSPVFLDVQSAILDALRPFPDARSAVISALRRTDVAPPPMIEGHADAA